MNKKFIALISIFLLLLFSLLIILVIKPETKSNLKSNTETTTADETETDDIGTALLKKAYPEMIISKNNEGYYLVIDPKTKDQKTYKLEDKKMKLVQ